VLAVMLGVMTAGLGMMVFGMAGMTVGAVGVVRRLLVIAGLMMLGGFAVMLGGVFVMFGRLVMMLDACVVAHVSLPVGNVKRAVGLRNSPDNVLTASRQLCCGSPVVKPAPRSRNRHCGGGREARLRQKSGNKPRPRPITSLEPNQGSMEIGNERVRSRSQ
jgi:hypothetical protein